MSLQGPLLLVVSDLILIHHGTPVALNLQCQKASALIGSLFVRASPLGWRGRLADPRRRKLMGEGCCVLYPNETSVHFFKPGKKQSEESLTSGFVGKDWACVVIIDRSYS